MRNMEKYLRHRHKVDWAQNHRREYVDREKKIKRQHQQQAHAGEERRTWERWKESESSDGWDCRHVIDRGCECFVSIFPLFHAALALAFPANANHLFSLRRWLGATAERALECHDEFHLSVIAQWIMGKFQLSFQFFAGVIIRVSTSIIGESISIVGRNSLFIIMCMTWWCGDGLAWNMIRYIPMIHRKVFLFFSFFTI